MFCANHPAAPKDAEVIGNPDLISGRGSRVVPVLPGGVLNDYVPFYLGTHSPMLYGIKTGYHAQQRPQREIVYMCSELSRVQALLLPYAFTDGHAYMQLSRFYDTPTNLSQLDWDVIPARKWSRTDEDNDRQRRKQAEFLLHWHVPVAAIISVVVYDQEMANWVGPLLAGGGSGFQGSRVTKVVLLSRPFAQNCRSLYPNPYPLCTSLKATCCSPPWRPSSIR